MAHLAELGARVDDVEQVVVRRQLVLGVLVTTEMADQVSSAARQLAVENSLSVRIEPVDTTPTERGLGVVVTVLAQVLSPVQLGAAATAIASAGGNIDRIVRLARYPVTAYELSVSGASIEALRPAVVDAAQRLGFDAALQAEGLGRRAQRLVVLDVDSTLIQDEVVELLADEVGCGAEVRSITERAMAGELDFEASLRARVGLLAGATEAMLQRVRDNVQLTPGARTFVRTLQRLGFRVAIVSGGFTFVTDALADSLGLDHAFANELEMRDGVATGELVGAIVDRARKAELLAHIAELEDIPLDQTVAVGDGANDLDMLALAGLGIAFNAKPVVSAAADTTVNVPFLDAILFVLGVRRSEVEAADDADGIEREDPPVAALRPSRPSSETA